MRKNKTAKMGIVVAILLLTVAFAAISTTLTINGTASVTTNNAEFEQNIVFANADDKVPYLLVNDSAEKVNVTVAQDRKSITFAVPEAFNTVGNKAVLHYWVANESANYDATIKSITCKLLDSEGNATTDEYITVTPANNLVNAVVKRDNFSQESTVDVAMTKAYAGEGTAEYKVECTITADGTSAE